MRRILAPVAAVFVGPSRPLDRHRPLRSRIARSLIAIFACAATITAATITIAPAAAFAATCGTNVMNIVAHEDDDILFLSPDLLHDVQSGSCVTTVYMTAGDAGVGQAHWSAREQGARAGYANMAGLANSWSQGVTSAAGHSIVTYTLAGSPNIKQLFMRLPDGSPGGEGFPSNNNESLQKLWTGAIGSIHPVDGSAAYTAQTLVDTLVALMTAFQPGIIRVQDYVGALGDGDHSDHHVGAYFAHAAHLLYTTQHTLIGYQGYGEVSRPENVAGTDLTAKQNAFYAYAVFDTSVCGSTAACAGTSYEEWLLRQYVVASESGPAGNGAPTANAGPGRAVAVGSVVQLDGLASSDPDGDALSYLWTQTAGPAVSLSDPASATPTFVAPATATTLTFQLVVNDGQTDSAPSTVTIVVGTGSSSNVARIATASASSENVSTGQTADKAIDGVVDGYPGDHTKEWATISGGAGSWLRLTWADPTTLARVILDDRPNTNDQITSATLTFDGGTTINIGALPNDGSPLTVTVPNINTRTLTLTVTSVSPTTVNIGLAEIQAWTPATAGNGAPTANAGPGRAVAVGSVVQLDGLASSDPDGDALSYLWTQTAGPAVSLSDPASATPTFVAPATATTLTFQLVVNDGQTDSAPSTVTIVVGTGSSSNVARIATASASSENVSTGQTADKAIDGVVDGYPGDHTKEWATISGGAGSWLRLTWAGPTTLARVILDDRPNTNDQITSATLTFDGGTTINIGALPNDGSPLTVTVPNINTRTLTLTVTSVSPTTVNTGLAEIQAWTP